MVSHTCGNPGHIYLIGDIRPSNFSDTILPLKANAICYAPLGVALPCKRNSQALQFLSHNDFIAYFNSGTVFHDLS